MAASVWLAASTSAMPAGGGSAGGGLRCRRSSSQGQILTRTGKQKRWPTIPTTPTTQAFQLGGLRGEADDLARESGLLPIPAVKPSLGAKFSLAASAGTDSRVGWTTRRSMKAGRRCVWCSAASDDGAGHASPLSVVVQVLEKEDDNIGDKLAEEEMHAKQVLEKEKSELSRGELLWRAAKPPMYSVAIVPLSVGGAVAFWTTGVFHAARYWLMFLSSVLIITWLNLSNDAYDSQTGVDENKRESVVNITGSLKGVLWASYGCLCAGFAGLVAGAAQAGDGRVAALLGAAIFCGYVYQGPPFRLSYKGLGEPLCFLAFGPLATTAFYLSQVQQSGAVMQLQQPGTILGVSVIVGVTTALILFCSHFHQIEGDTLAGKVSPLVRIGTENGSRVVQAAVIGLYGLVGVLTAARTLPLACSALVLLTLPIARLMLEFIKKNHANTELIFMAKYYAVRLHLSFGVALIMGFVLTGRLQLPA